MKTTRRQFLSARPLGSLLVVVYLRGGADGLSLVVPYTESAYYEARPTLALAPPDGTEPDAVLPLDAQFGLHPRLSPLRSMFDAGDMTVVHAVGSDDATRSHFEAQDRMEHAGDRAGSGTSGWLARLQRARGAGASLSTVALGARRPESLRGAPAVSVLRSAHNYRLGSLDDAEVEFALAQLYAGSDGDPLAAAGSGALRTLKAVRSVQVVGSSALYPDHAFGSELRELAALVRADAGVEVAALNLDGWDTHFVQASSLADNAAVLAEGLCAFAQDLGPAWATTTVVVMTEFGRRLFESTSMGTDHGRASVMLICGGGLDGGRVVTDWPGLSKPALEGPGDLRVTIDYRDVLIEVLRSRHRVHDAAGLFPGHDHESLSLFG